MYTLIIIMSLFFVWSIYYKIKNKLCFEEFPLLFVNLIALMIIGIIMILGSSLISKEQVYIEELMYEIASISDQNELSGRFFLGSGSIDEKPKYMFYYKVYGGGFRLGNIDASSNVTIVECDTIKPSIYKYNYYNVVKNRKIRRWVLIPKLGYYEYSIYVPKGAVIKRFNLDLEL